MFIDSSSAAEPIKRIKLQLMHLQLESNMILDDYKQYIKRQTLNEAVVGIYNTAAQLNVFLHQTMNCVFKWQCGPGLRRPPVARYTLVKTHSSLICKGFGGSHD